MSGYVWATRRDSWNGFGARDNGPTSYAAHRQVRAPVETRYDDTLEPVRRGAVSGQGKSPAFRQTYFDPNFYRHDDVPFLSEQEGGQGYLKFIREQVRKGLTVPIFRAYQDADSGPYGRMNPFIDRINLDRGGAQSFGAAVDSRTAGMVSYGY